MIKAFAVRSSAQNTLEAADASGAKALPGRALASATAVGLALRLIFIAWTTPLRLSLDEARFWDLATTRMQGTAFLPPLVPCFLIAVRSVLGDTVTGARVVMACLSSVSIPLVFVLAERHLGAGRSAAWVVALTPTLVYFDGRLRNEPIAIVLLLGFAVLWTHPAARRSWAAFGAGLLLGLTALIRPEFILLPIVLIVLRRASAAGRPTTREWVLVGAAALVPILPWAIRNHREIGGIVLVSTNGGYNFWKSFNPATDGSQVADFDYGVWRDVPEVDMDSFGYREGWRFIRTHPVRSLALAPLKLGHLFGPERDFLSDLRGVAFPIRLRALDLVWAACQNAVWCVLLAGGLLALFGPRWTPVKEFVRGIVLTLVLVHLVFFGDDRFHVPAIPFLCTVLPETWRDRLWRLSGWRVRATLSLLVLEGLVWGFILLRDLPKIARVGWGP